MYLLRLFLYFITTCQRSLGQGNVFSQMFVCPRGRGGGIPACITGHMTGIQEGIPTGGSYLQMGSWTDPTGTRKAGGTHPTGMISY